MEPVTREVDLDAPPSDVWEAVTTPDQLEQWFGSDVDGEIAPGEVVRFTSPDGTVRRALIERVDEPRELAFRWLPGPDVAPSRVVITVEPHDDGSVLRVVERRVDAAISDEPRIGFRALARAGA